MDGVTDQYNDESDFNESDQLELLIIVFRIGCSSKIVSLL